MAHIEFTDPRIHDDTFVPYTVITYTTSLDLDSEIFLTLRVFGDTVKNMLVEEFRTALERNWPARFHHLEPPDPNVALVSGTHTVNEGDNDSSIYRNGL